MSAVDLSGTIALVAVGVLTRQPAAGAAARDRLQPGAAVAAARIKLFTFHNWTGYAAFWAVVLHAGVLLFSREPRFRIIDVLVPIWSPVQPLSNTLGAIGFYLVSIVVVTSLKRSRTALGRHRWKAIHYTNYAAAAVFFVHGVIADPLLKGRPVDLIDAEKVYVEACAAIVLAVTVWRIRHRRAVRRAARA